MKRSVIGLAVVLIVLVAAYVFLIPDVIHPGRVTASPQIQRLLIQLGDSALASRDVPVSAVLVYRDDIIGEGYNTVLRDGNAAGHAEINAITNAIRRHGLASFMKLNRDSLLLISTLEPCPMCRAALALYRVKRVEFLKEKSLFYRAEEDLESLLYRFREKKIDPDSLQEFLFRKHPDFLYQRR